MVEHFLTQTKVKALYLFFSCKKTAVPHDHRRRLSVWQACCDTKTSSNLVAWKFIHQLTIWHHFFSFLSPHGTSKEFIVVGVHYNMFVGSFWPIFLSQFCDVSPSLSTPECLNACILPVLMSIPLTADSIARLKIEETFRRPDLFSKLNSCKIKSLKLHLWRFFTDLIARIHHQIKILQIFEMQCQDEASRNYIYI